MSNFRLWLVRRGIELEWHNKITSIGGFQRHFSIAVNHRYFGINIMLEPYQGAFMDELNTPHADIAAQYEQDAQR